MGELRAELAVSGLPITHGTVTLSLRAPEVLTSLAPRPGHDLGAALTAACGLALPGVGQSTCQGDVRCLWFGRAHYLLIGAAFEGSGAHQTDQTDGWAAFMVEGAGARDVLARLTPLDLRPSVFAVDATARSFLGHMSASLTRVAEEGYLILVFRSMAVTARDELSHAMQTVAARAV